MNSRRTITRYLLGELPESERTALERRYFSDPRVFEEVARIEAGLVDDYVLGRLAAETRRRFEEFYLAHPERRERVAFAEALAARVDPAGVSRPAGARPSPAAGSGRRRGLRALIDALGGPRPAAGLATASLLIVSGLVWYTVESSRPDREHAADRGSASQPPSGGGPAPGPTPGPVPEVPAPAVTLALAVGPGVRGAVTGPPTTLVIPPGTGEVRLELSLRENDYPGYRVSLRPVGGAEMLGDGESRPAPGPSGPVINLTLPADRFTTGDYILTLQGATGEGAFEDLSQSLLRVERR